MQHKVPNAKLLSISPLEKTATHDLPALLDKLLSHCPSFKHALVRSTADMKKHSALDYGKAAQRACDAPSSCGTRCLGISTENQFVMSSFSPVWPPTEYEW